MTRFVRLPVAAWLVAAAAACGGAASGANAPPPRVEEVSDSAPVFRAPAGQAVATVRVMSQLVPDRMRGTCTVSPDVNRVVPVNPLGGGRVVALRAGLGDRVARGQVLLTIASPDLAAALDALRRAEADQQLATAQSDRAGLLFAHGTIARKDLEVAQDAEAKARVDLATARQEVEMLGGDPAQSDPEIVLRSPIAGTIVGQNVTPGQAVTAGAGGGGGGPSLFTVADLSTVWVLCAAYEDELPRLRSGEPATVTLDAYPDRRLAGRVSNVSQVLDSATRTATVRIVLANRDGLMRPGMFGTAEVRTSAGTPRAVLPTTALVQMHDAFWAFVADGHGGFRRTRVTVGGEVAPGVQDVLSGVSSGDEVVRDALAFMQSVSGP